MADSESVNTRAARTGIRRMKEGDAVIAEGRAARDAAIVKMYHDDGLNAPQIAKALNMSTTRVRQIVELAEARAER